MNHVDTRSELFVHTAKSLLSRALTLTNELELPELLKTDPDRLRQEFLAIAVDPSQRFNFRARSLTILSRHADELNARGSSEAVETLVTAFEKEFPREKLLYFAATKRGEDSDAEAFMAHLYCITLATLGPASTEECVKSVQFALKNTELGTILTRHLELIKRS